jgi:hypothetical protein
MAGIRVLVIFMVLATGLGVGAFACLLAPNVAIAGCGGRC